MNYVKNDVSVDVVIENSYNENIDSRKRKIVISDENCNDDNVEVVCQNEMNDAVSSCKINDSGLKNFNNFQNYVSVLYKRHISFSHLQETFWDDDYVNGIRHMYEGVIYESNGKNCRQGVAIMISNDYKNSSKLDFKDDYVRFIHVTYDYQRKV
ncbi:unnamed protein product [Mytilus coruscus]|uniref:Uncharacterized protein n=1 Tax=Mytilus coruscus TaxID=42192 RepID=A0A6J8DUH3_MYTCO|nr:unnamed protein product [Mytilus coruscus]